MMKDEYDEACVEQGQSDHNALITLNRIEHLVQERIQVGKAAHENCYGYQTAQSIVPLNTK
jgi:hypothetical protein